MSEIKKPRSKLNIALWVVQILLAVVYLAAGAVKTFTPIAELATQMSFVADSPVWFVRLIGIAEIAGAIGLIVPAITRILPWLTPLAALGFVVVQAGAIVSHASYGELAQYLPLNLGLLLLALFVLWGRIKKSPITAR